MLSGSLRPFCHSVPADFPRDQLQAKRIPTLESDRTGSNPQPAIYSLYDFGPQLALQ